MSNLSNITSYEFESKILRNNYQQYLLRNEKVGSLNGDLEAIR
jgi:hypothetical protein